MRRFPIFITFLLILCATSCRETGPDGLPKLKASLYDERGWQTSADFEAANDMSAVLTEVGSEEMKLNFFGWSQDDDFRFSLDLPEGSVVSKANRVVLKYTMCGWNKGPADWDMTTQIMVQDKENGEWYELSRCITPYGGSFSNSWRKEYYLDVTPLLPLLKGKTDFKIFYCGWDATETKAHAVQVQLLYFHDKQDNGTPYWRRKVYDSTLSGNTGYRSWAYGVQPADSFSIENTERLGKRTISFPAGTKRIVLRACFTGHGQDALTVGNGKFPNRSGYKANNVAEFDKNWYYLYLNGFGMGTEAVIWEVNSKNYAQAGTYKYNRCGWGPGKPCNVHYWLIENLRHSDTSLTIDIDLDEYIGKNTKPNAESVAQFYVEVDAFGYK